MDDVITNIKNEYVSGIEAPPGFGKSTYIIQKLIEQGLKIFVSELTILSVHNLTSYQNRNIENCGFAANTVINYTNSYLDNIKGIKTDRKDNQLVYCTSKHLEKIIIKCLKQFYEQITIRQKMSDQDLQKTHKIYIPFCDLIVIDEAHEGTMEHEQIMRYIKYARHLNIIFPNLLLMSANLDLSNTVFKDLTKIVKFIPTGIPSEIIYLNIDIPLTSKNAMLELFKLLRDDLLSTNDANDNIWLVFLAGMYEINYFYDQLLKLGIPNLEILSVHSTLQQVNFDKLFTPLNIGDRRIIISTNICELAITIEGVTRVYDSMCENISSVSQSGTIKLTTNIISKNSADQRAGRTNRTNKGKTFRMCTEQYYNNNIAARKESDIKRLPPLNPILNCIYLGIDPLIIYQDILSIDKYKNIISTLYEIGLVSIVNKTLIVTDKGYFSTKYPINIKFAAILYNWIKCKRNLFIGIVLICILDCLGNGSYLYYPLKTQEQTYEEYNKLKNDWFDKYFIKYTADNDLEFMFNVIFDIFINCKNDGNIDYKKIAHYTQKNSLNNKKIIECLRLIMFLIHEFNVENISNDDIKNNINLFIEDIKTLFQKSIFTKIDNHYIGDTIYANHSEQLCKKSSGYKIIAILLTEIEKCGKRINLISFSLPYI